MDLQGWSVLFVRNFYLINILRIVLLIIITWGICTRRAGKLYKARSRLAGWLVNRTIFKN